MTTASADTVRDELRALGEERAQRDVEDAALIARINAALAKIGGTGIAKTEAAALLGVHRTTLYRVYKV